MLGVSSLQKRLFSNQLLRSVSQAQIDGMKSAGTHKVERVITSPQDMEITVNGKKVLNFCANNYLGLSNHPRVVKSAQQTIDTHGFGVSSVRFICGTQDIHKDLERKIAEFHKLDDCILYPSGFDSNAGFFESIMGPEDAIISDELNHASIIDGVRLSKCRRLRFKHMDMDALEKNLQESQDCRLRAIVTDGVFSMDGDIAPLDKIVELAKKYDAFTFVDECHATGVFGRTGKGTPELFGLEGEIDVISSTLGKALGGGTGGYTAASREVVDVLRNKGRPYLFSNSIAPCVAGASIEVFRMLEESTELLDSLRSNTTRMRKGLKEAGFTIAGHDDCPIAPVMIGDARKAAGMADELMNHEIYVIGFSYPVVPKDKARIRMQLSAAHTND
jgi:glycine C-acetyltransferase